MTPDAEWVVSPDAAFVDDGTRVVTISLTELAACRPHVLEETAASIWRALGAGRESAIIQTIAQRYDATEADVADDVRSFLHELKAKGLVEIAG
jgi:hypothetical protein